MEFLKNCFLDLLHSFLALIYKQKCLICSRSKDDKLLCENCSKDVQYLSCFAQRIYLKVPVFCACSYDGVIKKLIHLIKFHHRKKVSFVLGEVLFNYYKKLDLKGDFIVCFVPSYYLKITHRGYNHMYLIAKEFAKLANLELSKNLIKKIKYTKPQYKAKNKKENIKGSFALNKKELLKYKNKTILLLDDITTSGATLKEIINIFKDSGIDNMVCLCVSKTV